MGIKSALNLRKQTSKVFKKFGQNALAKQIVTLVVFILILNTAYCLGVRSLLMDVLGSDIQNQIDSKYYAIMGAQDVDMKQLATSVNLLTQADPQVGQRLSEGDFGYLNEQMGRWKAQLGIYGFVIADTEGNLQGTSFKNDFSMEQRGRMEEFFRFVNNKSLKSYTGAVDVLNVGVCFGSTVAVQDTMGETAAYVFLSCGSFYDSNYVSQLADNVKMDLSIFKGNFCVATSIPNTDDYKMLGSALIHDWMPDSVKAVGQRPIHTRDRVAGSTFYSSFFCVRDYKNEMVATCHCSMPDHVVNYIRLHVVLRLSFMGLVFGLALISVFIFIFYKFITGPIRQMRAATVLIADGDLTAHIEVPNNNHDEVQELAENLIVMRDNLKETIAQVLGSSKVLSAASGEMSKASMNLSDAANKQAAALEEISSSLEEMTGNIHQNTDNAMMTDELMMKCDKAVISIADEATESMNDTRKIAGSIRAINSLVNQTNILSLNASVEAARAGSAGKGFAVVAREVGRLAEQTKTTSVGVSDIAAKSIAGAENINALLDDVAPQLHKVVSLIKEISVSSQEQGIGADQINIAIASLNKVTQETAANAEEIAANAEELASTADKMNKMVSEFKVS